MEDNRHFITFSFYYESILKEFINHEKRMGDLLDDKIYPG